MNKIIVKNESWLLLKKEVEEYVLQNKNNFIDFYSFIKLLIIIFFCIYFYINVLLVKNYISIFFNSIGLIFSLSEMAMLSHSLTHNLYFNNKKLNTNLSFFWDLFLGISKDFWRYKHNSIHHIYTNINNKDGDIDAGVFFRFSKYQKKYWFHKYQYLYAPFLYLFNYFNMLIVYNIKYFEIKKRTFFESLKFIFFKILFLFFLLLPFYTQKIELSIIYFFNLLLFGLITSIVLGVSHLFYGVEMIDEQQEHDFLILQTKTTSNHSANIISNELFFGLNYQLEHHLFPQLHYYYYPKINNIIKKHIAKNNLTYHYHDNIFKAMISHFKFLKEIGKE